MSYFEISTTLLHLRDSDDHDDKKIIYYAGFRSLLQRCNGLSADFGV